MTLDEHNKILTSSFYDLWTGMWVTKSIHSHRQEYDKSYRRFKECIEDVREYIRTLTHTNTDPEWTFPKGRPHCGESDIDCAKREFEEETGIRASKLRMITSTPLVEVYTGTNGIIYETHLYIATVDVKKLYINPRNRSQIEEVSAVAWISPMEIRERMRSTYLSKEIVLREAIEQFLMKS
jgi:8-oxo-dGTP pyrophosphatase MutT (NUDIX family)